MSGHLAINLESVFGLAVVVLLLWRSDAGRERSYRPRLTLDARDALLMVLIALMIGAAFWRATRLSFLSDDYVLVSMAQTFPGNYRALFTQGGGDGFFRPLGYLSLAWTWPWAGLDPNRWHWVGLLLHLGSSLLVYFLAGAIGLSRGYAWLASALFAWHGAHPEAVVWIAGRFDVLAAFFALLALAAFIKLWEESSLGWGAVGLVAMCLGLLSKESAYGAPLAMLIYAACTGRLARTTEPGPESSRELPADLEGRAGPVRASGRLARTTEPGPESSCEFPADLEGRAGPVRASGRLARTTEPGPESSCELPADLEGRAGRAALWNRRIRYLAPFFLLAAVLFAYRWRLQGGIGGYLDPAGRPQALSLNLVSISKALGLRLWAVLFFPVNWAIPAGAWLGIATAVYAATWVALIWTMKGKRNRLLIPLGFVLAMALPPVQQLLIGADLEKSRLVYLPSAGFCLLAASAVSMAGSRLALRWGAGLVMLAFNLVALLHNLGGWETAATKSKTVCEAVAACSNPAVEGLPRTLNGVYFFANGLPECVRLERAQRPSAPLHACSLSWDAATGELRSGK